MEPADILVRTAQLLESDRLTEATRRVLKARLEQRFGAPQVLDTTQMRTLRAASARLIPSALAEVVDLAGALDARLAEAAGDGWRYAEAAPDLELQRRGLDALDGAARARSGAGFAELDPPRQDALLQAACDETLDLPPRWFEELLAALVELHYSHPAVQVEMGYDGMADARGFTSVGLAQVASEAGHDG